MNIPSTEFIGLKALVLSFLLVFVLSACDQPTAIEQVPEQPEISEEAKAINQSLTYVAKTLAAALVDADVRRHVKAETGKMFDGDHNVSPRAACTRSGDARRSQGVWRSLRAARQERA